MAELYEIYAPEDVEAQHKNWTNEENMRALRQIMEHFPKAQTVLDYGCGTGRLSQFFKNYVGFDRCAAMVEFAKRAYPGKKFSTMLPNEKFDLVVALSVVQYADDKSLQAVLEEMCTRSKKYVLIQTWESGGEPFVFHGFKDVAIYARPWKMYENLLSRYGKIKRILIEEHEKTPMVVYLLEKNSQA